ncbi:PTS sugar transporter subunit IIA [Hankyongella ginsenosidimutans]|uniref:PTS sugar transporter subunit IIA n=1 Tax=Hankyongella ginsenosidimutans TaxID=1763828 RepID=UPI00319EA914
MTGVGNGIAIPHAKLPGLDRLIGIFVTLEQPVDYQSIDSAPVDIACMLLAPTDAGASHLQALALVSRMLRQHGLCESCAVPSTTTRCWRSSCAASSRKPPDQHSSPGPTTSLSFGWRPLTSSTTRPMVPRSAAERIASVP